MSLGSLVRCTDNELGIGKVVSFAPPEATVEYFCSVGQRTRETFPVSSLRRIRLQRQTRCYIHNPQNDTWIIGRVYTWDEDEEKYQIDLPDRQTILVPETDIYVRCNQPIEDPIAILAMKGQETPYFHNLRSRLVKCLIEQRAAIHGMKGLISANIALYPHQVEVARRVLSDPIPRYLLADEVGLGKTIQAGIILRQFLLDEPNGKALILTPPHLLNHWQEELENKFYLSQFGERISIFSITDWRKLPKQNDSFDFLIIDEAHQVASMAESSDSNEQKFFTTCRQIAHQCNHLLLLSSLPILNHEREFLVMLHLLEPDNYKLEDIEKFREIIQQRQEIGRILFTFTEESQKSILKNQIKELQNIFQKDEYLQKLTLGLATELDNQETPKTEIEKQARTIRNHISDTYRIHRRMLRNRLIRVKDLVFKRHVNPKPEYDLDERSYEIHELLEKWRTLAPSETPYHSIFLVFLAASNTWLDILKQVIVARSKGVVDPRLKIEFNQDELKYLTEFRHFLGEEAILNSLLNLTQNPSEDGDRIELLKIILLHHLADALELQSLKGNLKKLRDSIKQRIQRPFAQDQFPKLVIFTSFSQVCSAIEQHLSTLFGSNSVVTHSRNDTREKVEQNLKEFQNNPRCFLLICDASGEEGRRLQFVDGVIHFDLPFSPNRIEHRLSRFDGVSGKTALNNWLLAGVDLEDSIAGAWFNILRNGFVIFDDSLANLESYLDGKLPEVSRIIFEQGAKGLLDTIETIQEEIKQEKIKLSEQRSIDEIDILEETAQVDYSELEQYDANHKNIEKSLESWLCNALNFQRVYDVNLKDVRIYKPSSKTLVNITDLKNYFAHCLTKKGVYNRVIANQNQGVNLYRIGEQLTDNLASYIEWDDRGQAFALWREDKNWNKGQGGEWIGFRFDYIIEANFAELEQLAEIFPQKSAIKRQADALFPPRLETVFINLNLEIVEDEELLKILSRPYRDSHDYNLAKQRISILNEFIEPSKWSEICYQARTSSEKMLRESPQFVTFCQQCSEKATKQFTNRITQLKLRLEHFSQTALTKEIQWETDLHQALLKGINYPRCRPNSVGFIIVSESAPHKSLS